MKLLTIIVSYNFERWIDRCLGSLRQSAQPTDVLVVDNASQDQTVTLIQQHYPEVRLIQSPENLGFGKANNLGLQIAIEEEYDAVFLLNQDAWIDSQTLGVLLEASKSNPQYGILSPVHLNGAGTSLDQGFAHYTHLTSLTQLKPSASSLQPVTVSFINAAFWLIPISVLKQIGGFCSLFYHYGEDVDYLRRIHYHGYSVGYVPSVFGYHDRENRKVSHEAWMRSERIYLLTELANINYSLSKALGYGLLAGWKKALIALLHGYLSDASTYTAIGFQLLGRMPQIIRCRKLNRQKGCWYLNIHKDRLTPLHNKSL